jgi:hypothetical protein
MGVRKSVNLRNTCIHNAYSFSRILIGHKEGSKMFLLILYYILTAVQGLMGYGTAYRLTKRGGDNGAALFGWMLLMSIAAAIPGLGIYLWYKYKDVD